MKIQILDLAKDDLICGYHFYEQKEDGLGDHFLSSLYSDIEKLKLSGGIHMRSYKGFFRALSKVFPFAIFYTVERDAVWIRSVVDCRRRPSWIRRHLKRA